MGFTRTVVIAGGDTPISDASWPAYQPSLGNQKNSDRHLRFNSSCFIRSPKAPVDCVGDACREIRELDGYTWVALSHILAADCLPSRSACQGTTAKPFGLLVVVIQKCHQIDFEGDVIFLEGPRGEQAIMHATSDGHPDLDVPLPPGWTLRKETLTTPLSVTPFGGPGECFYNVIRDSRLQSYHQLKYPEERYPDWP